MKCCVLSIYLMVFVLTCNATAGIANFDDLSLAANSSWSGDYLVDGTGGTYQSTSFASGMAAFANYSDGDWYSWAGFAYSNMTDNTTPGYGNQFSVATGSAHSGANFAVGYMDTYNGFVPTMTLNTPMVVTDVQIANTTYAYLFMLTGDSFFGEAAYGAGDYAKVVITGKDATGSVTGSVECDLADFTDGSTFVLDTWVTVDTSSLGVVSSMEFAIDTNRYFTPYYFALDTVVPEPTSLLLVGLGGVLVRLRTK